MAEVEPALQRWWIQPPLPDETLRSVVNRAAELYECPPTRLWECLNWDDPQPFGEVESPSVETLRRMAAAIGMRAPDLSAHRLPHAPWLLAPLADEVYCPMCWDEDQRRGDPLWTRRSWRRVLCTRCPTHDCALHLRPEHRAKWSAPRALDLPALAEHEQRILELIGAFGETLERSLYAGEPWPEDLRGSPHIARQMLLKVSFNMNTVRDLPLTKCVQTSGNMARYIHGPLHNQEPIKVLRWDAYRKIADPAIRRASLWITAWELMRERPDDLSPGWSRLPSHVEDMIWRK